MHRWIISVVGWLLVASGSALMSWALHGVFYSIGVGARWSQDSIAELTALNTVNALATAGGALFIAGAVFVGHSLQADSEKNAYALITVGFGVLASALAAIAGPIAMSSMVN